MRIAPLAEVKDRFSAYVDESRESPIVVTRNGRPVAMLISIEDKDDLDSLLLVHNPRFLELLEEARQRVRITGGIPLGKFRQELETAASEWPSHVATLAGTWTEFPTLEEIRETMAPDVPRESI